MPRTTGTYAAPSSSWNPPVVGTEASSTDWTALLADMTVALTDSAYTAGLGSATNRLIRTDGTDTKKIKGSGITVSDTDDIADLLTITIPNTGLRVLDTNATHYLTITPGSNLTQHRALTLVTGDANRAVTITADASIAGTNTGDQTITLTGDVTGSGTGSFAATIPPGAVTFAKIQNVSATARILGRKTSGSGVTEEITASDALDFLGSTRGSVLYRGASGWAILAPGTNGQFLKTLGSGADPVFASLPGGGDMLAANNLSDVASAATAFGNIKQAATTGATGVVQLATATEAAVGTDTGKSIAPSTLASTIANSYVIGALAFNNTVTPNTKLDMSANLVVMSAGASGSSTVANTGTKTNDTGAVGPVADGRDQAGAFGNSSWIHFYFIYNPTTSTLASVSSLTAPPTGPVLPSGYTRWAYVCSIYKNSSGNLVKSRCAGNQVWFEATQNVLNAGGNQTETAVSLTATIPPTAVSMILNCQLIVTGSTTCGYFLILRWQTGNTSVQARVDAAAATNVISYAGVSLISRSQQFYYLWSNIYGTAAGLNATIDCLGFTVSNGG